MSILRDVVIKEKDLRRAESQLLALPSLKRFSDNLKSAGEKNDFRQHMRRYLNIYLPDCPFEISGTNRYEMTTHEATIIARKPIKAGQAIKYLCGIRAILTEEEENDLEIRLLLLIYSHRSVGQIMTAKKRMLDLPQLEELGWTSQLWGILKSVMRLQFSMLRVILERITANAFARLVKFAAEMAGFRKIGLAFIPRQKRRSNMSLNRRGETQAALDPRQSVLAALLEFSRRVQTSDL
jgi:hypothetical protein